MQFHPNFGVTEFRCVDIRLGSSFNASIATPTRKTNHDHHYETHHRHPIYNERRYGKPYIGIVSEADGKVARTLGHETASTEDEAIEAMRSIVTEEDLTFSDDEP